VIEKKQKLLKTGISVFGDSYPKPYLENLRQFFSALEEQHLAKKNPSKRIRRFKTT
jgi:hypothetical protein